MLRHAAILALARIGDAAQLIAAANNESPAVRLGAVVALRRLQRKEVGLFLQDSDPLVVLEAARAINDEPIPGAVTDLAAVITNADQSEALIRRVMNANFRLGGAENATAVAEIAADSKVPEALRLEAIEELKQWNDPSPLDRVLGRWQPIENRKSIELTGIVGPIVPELFQSSEKVKTAGTDLAAKYGIKEAAPMLAEMVVDTKRPVEVRVASLKALDKLGYPQITNVAKTAIKDKKSSPASDRPKRAGPSSAGSRFETAGTGNGNRADFRKTGSDSDTGGDEDPGSDQTAHALDAASGET